LITPGRVIQIARRVVTFLHRRPTLCPSALLGALDLVYSGVNAGHRKAISALAEVDPVSEDMITGHLGDLEQFQWFVRAHLESAAGDLPTVDARTEKGAARAASDS